LRRILRRVLNLEPSSGGFSAGAFDGVAALDASFELSEAAVEAGRAFSAVESAMASRVCCSNNHGEGYVDV